MRHDLEKNDLLEVLLHFGCLFAGEILEEFTNADLDSLLARIHHMLCQVSQEHIVVLLLMVGAEELSDSRVVHVVE